MKVEILMKQLKGLTDDLSDEEIERIENLITADVEDCRPSSIQSIVLGTFILWICWLFFNAGSTNGMLNPKNNAKPEEIMMNTILCSAASGITAVFVKYPIMGLATEKRKKYDVQALCNGILVGLVTVTAMCANIEPWAALISGLLSGIVYSVACRALYALKIDDPIEASQVHGAGGFLGVMLTSFFDRDHGSFYGHGGKQFGI